MTSVLPTNSRTVSLETIGGGSICGETNLDATSDPRAGYLTISRFSLEASETSTLSGRTDSTNLKSLEAVLLPTSTSVAFWLAAFRTALVLYSLFRWPQSTIEKG